MLDPLSLLLGALVGLVLGLLLARRPVVVTVTQVVQHDNCAGHGPGGDIDDDPSELWKRGPSQN